MTTPHSDLASEAARAAPTITVGGLTLFGVGLSDWVLITTLIYTALQVFFLLRDKCYRPWRDKNGRK